MSSYDYWNDLEKQLNEIRFQIGGRSTDIEQIAYSLSYFIKNSFPLNGVPKDIVEALNSLTMLLEKAGSSYQQTIEWIILECKKNKQIV